MIDNIAKIRVKILNKEYAAFRNTIVEYFVKKVLPKSKVVLDPMAGTAPLIPYIEYYGLKAFFNDILPLHYYLNRAKTYRVYNSVKSNMEKKSTFLESESKKCLARLKNKNLVMSENWIHDDVLDALLYAWEKTNTYEKNLKIIFQAIIILCVRPFSCISPSSKNTTWNKCGGITTEKNIGEIIKENIDKFLTFYKNYYEGLKIKGGDITFSTQDASELTLTSKVDTILTSPPYANRYDYTRMYVPELFFLSKIKSSKKYDIAKVSKMILGTNEVVDYQNPEDDLQYFSEKAPRTKAFLYEVASKGKKGEKNYYLRYFTKYYINLYNMLGHLIKFLRKGGSLYLVVQNNIHRGELNQMDQFIIDYFQRKELRAEPIFQELRIHQGRRNISADHPLVLKNITKLLLK